MLPIIVQLFLSLTAKCRIRHYHDSINSSHHLLQYYDSSESRQRSTPTFLSERNLFEECRFHFVCLSVSIFTEDRVHHSRQMSAASARTVAVFQGQPLKENSWPDTIWECQDEGSHWCLLYTHAEWMITVCKCLKKGGREKWIDG